MNALRLIMLYAPSALEEAVADTLLALEPEHGFSSFPVNFHHHDNKRLTLAEQVSGRQKQICFQAFLDEAGMKLLLERLRQEFSGSGIRVIGAVMLEHILI